MCECGAKTTRHEWGAYVYCCLLFKRGNVVLRMSEEDDVTARRVKVMRHSSTVVLIRALYYPQAMKGQWSFLDELAMVKNIEALADCKARIIHLE